MPAWGLEIRHALRSTFRRRGGSGAAASLAAIGVGLLSAMFAVADPYTLRDLPYPAPNRLAVVRIAGDGLAEGTPVPTLNDLRQAHDLFDGVAFVRPGLTLRFENEEGALAIQVLQVSEDFFRVVGLPTPRSADWRSEGTTGIVPALVTAEGRRHLPDASIQVGSVIRTDQGGLRIVGLLPEGFIVPSSRGPVRADVLTAMTVQDVPVVAVDSVGRNGRRFANDPVPLLTRLAPTASADIVRERLSDGLIPGRRTRVQIEPLRAAMLGDAQLVSWGALAAGSLVLFACAANVGNLMLVRAAHRTRELHTREALGATGLDIVRLWTFEFVALAVASAVGGLGITAATLVAVDRTVPELFSSLGSPRVTLRVIVFAALAAALVFATAIPPIAISRVRGSRKGPASAALPNGRRWRLLLMTLQAAMAMILAMGAGLLLRSYYELVTQDTGFDKSSAVLTVSYPVVAGSTTELMPTVLDTLGQLARVPGVKAVGATSGQVVSSGISSVTITAGGQSMRVGLGQVTPAFFEAAGMRILEGRALSETDSHWRGVVVNQSLAHAAFGDSSPLGQLVIRNNSHAVVVGVVRDAYDKTLDRHPTPTLYETLAGGLSSITYVMSPGASAMANAQSVRRAIAAVTSKGAPGRLQTIASRYDSTVRDRTFATVVLALFGIAGVAVCATGVAGLVAFVVNRRTSELSLRLILGASTGQILWLVARDAVGAAIVGGVLGLGLGHGMSRWLEHFVYGITPGDVGATLCAGGVLLGVVLVSAVVPALRAARLNPSVALRVE